MASVQNLLVRIGADISGLTSGIRNATTQLNQLAKQNEKAFQAVGAVGKAMTVIGGAGVAGLGMAVKTTANFESAMSRVGALSGATAEELRRLTENAEEMGRKTSFSATQAAEAQQFLAMAGFKTNNIIAAMPGLLATAAAGQTDLGETADIVSNILSGFGLQAEETSRVADVMTKTFTNSNTDLRMLGLTMKYVSPVAKAAGQSMESMAAATGILGNAGIQADQAGTSLRMMLIRLAKPPKMAKDALDKLGISVSDSQGNMKDLSQIIGEMSEATKGMTEAERLATVAKISGTEASAAMLALMDAGQGTIEAFTKELENSGGTAEEIAAKQLDNLLGQLTILKSALEGAAIAIGSALLPALKVVVAIIQRAVDWFNGLSDASKKFIAIGGALGSVFMIMVGPLLILVSMIPTLTAGFGAIAGALGMTSMALLSGIALWGGIITAIIAVGSALFFAYNEIEWFRNGVNSAWAWISDATVSVGSAIKTAFGDAVDWSVKKFDDFKVLAVNVGGHVQGAVDAVRTKFGELQTYIGGLSSNLFGKVSDKANEFIKNIKSIFSGDPSALTPVLTALAPTIIGLLVGGIPGILISASRFLPAIAKGMESGTPKIIGVINDVVNSIVGFLENSFPNLVQTGLGVVLNLVNGILAALPSIIEVGVSLIETLIGTVASLLPQILMMGIGVLTALLEGIVTAIPLLVEGVISVIDSIVQTIVGNLPTVIDSGVVILTSLVDGLTNTLPILVMAALLLITEVVSALVRSLPKILESGVKILLTLVDGILTVLPMLINTALKLIVQIASTLIANLPKIIDSGVKILMALVNGIIQILPTLIATALKLIVQIASTLIANLPKILAAGVKIVWELIKGIVSIVGSLGSAVKNDIVPAIVDTIKNIDLFKVGKDIIQGLINGVGSMAGNIGDKVKELAAKIPSGIKAFLGIHSPSRVLMELGVYTGEGFALGIESMVRDIERASTNMANAAMPEVSMEYERPNVGSVGVQAPLSADDVRSVGQAASKPVYITIVQELDGYEVARTTAPYIDVMQANKVTLNSYMKGGSR